MRIENLENGGCLRALLLLYERNELKSTDFREAIHYQTFQRVCEILSELGLITIRSGEGRTILHTFKDLGKEVARYVAEIESLLP